MASNETFAKRKLVLPVFLPSFLFSTAEFGIIPSVPATALMMGADLATAGFITGLMMIGRLCADIPAAKFVDVLGERKAMIAASVSSALGILLSLFALNLFMLGAGVFIVGAAAAVFGLARLSWMTEHVPVSVRARSLSILGGMFRAGSFIGPVIGAVVIRFYSVQAVYYLPLVLCALAAIILFFAKGKEDLAKNSSSLKATFIIAKRESKKLATLGLASSILSALRGSRMIGLPLLAIALNMPAEQASLYIGFAGALDFAMFYLSGQVMDRFGRGFAAVPTLLGLGLTHLIVGFAVDANTFLILALLMSLANGLGSGVIMVLGADLAPKDARSEFLASYRLLVDFGDAAAPGILSGLVLAVGLTGAMAGFGFLGFVGAGLMYKYIPKYAVQPANRS
ncbi:MAG: MFS transporter [Micrococcales bacterium]|jgi:MFS family permease|nr:MFS transporter [Actinomycetota bacterium]NCA07602.1 MFS transporter [Micrococcales bacterium]